MESTLTSSSRPTLDSKQTAPPSADHLVDRISDPLVQFEDGPGTQPAATSAASEGVSGGGGPLPHRDVIQRSFGSFDVSGITAHTGGKAAAANESFGSNAYAMGSSVAFKSAPSLHTAAHEAAHTVQQSQGVQLEGGFGTAGDVYEQHADAVADKVVAGESAEPLLASGPGGGQAGSAVQFENGQGGSLLKIETERPEYVIRKLEEHGKSEEEGTLGFGKNAAKTAFVEHFFKPLSSAMQWRICQHFAGQDIDAETDLSDFDKKAWKSIKSGFIVRDVDWEGLSDHARGVAQEKPDKAAGKTSIDKGMIAKASVAGGKGVNGGTGQTLALAGQTQESLNSTQLGGPSLAILGSLVALVDVGVNAYKGQGAAELAQAGAEATVEAARDSAKLAHNVIVHYGAAGSAAASWAAFGGLAIFAGLVQAGVGLYTFVKKKAQRDDLTALASKVDPSLRIVAEHAATNADTAMKAAAGKGASGVLTVGGGVALLALGMSNPVGWMVMAGVGAVAAAIGVGMSIWKYFQKSKAKKTLAIQALNLKEDASDSDIQKAVGSQGYISVDHWYRNYTLNQAVVLHASAHQDGDERGRDLAREMIQTLGAGTVTDGNRERPSVETIASKMSD